MVELLLLLLPILGGESVQVSSRSAEEWTRIGESELKRGEEGGPAATAHFEAAEHALDKALSLEPELATALHALASVDMRTGRTEDAADLLKRGVVARPDAAR